MAFPTKFLCPFSKMDLSDFTDQHDLGRLCMLFATLTLCDIEQLCTMFARLTLGNDVDRLRRMLAKLTLDKTIEGCPSQYCLPKDIAKKRKDRDEADEERQIRKRRRVTQCNAPGKSKVCEDRNEDEHI